MKLINTSGMAFLGTGSDWLWAMVQALALVVTLVAIYRQVRLQRAASAIGQMQELEDRWSTERTQHLKLRLALALRQGGDPDTNMLALQVTNFFDDLGYLHRRGFLATEALAIASNSLLVDAVRWWTLLEPTVRRWQAESGPVEAADFERLAAEGRRWMAGHGVPEFPTDPASIAGRLDWIIDRQARWLRVEHEIGARVLPALPEAPVAA